MSDQTVQAASAELITWIKNSLEASSGFVQAQAPDVVNQLLIAHAIERVIFLLVGLALMILFACRNKIASCFKGTFDEEFNICMMKGCTILLALIGGAVALCNLHGILTIWLAPKYYIFEQIRHM